MKSDRKKNYEVKSLKKFTSSKELNKIAKATLAMVLAGSFTFSATRAFAEGGSTQTDQNQTVEVQANTSSTNSNVSEQATEKQKSPSLLPGDFFYFAKIALEKIKLALTFDDAKEAKLLASNASERLAEAEALFATGNQKAAVETIKDALEAMKDADKFVDDQQGTTVPKEDELKDETPSTEEQATAEEQGATSEKSTTEGQATTQDQEEATKDEQVSDNQATEDVPVAKEDETGLENVKSVLSQNIIALTAAMEKVKNPVAKAALQKNIDKSYAKLAKKIDKWENYLAKKHEKEAQKKHEQEDATTVENSSADVEAAVEKTTPIATNVKTEQEAMVTLPNKVEQKAKVTPPAKTVELKAKHEIQSVQKEAHVEVKQAQQVAKQKREETKVFVQQKKEEVKQKVEQIKEEHTGNNGNKH